MSDAGMDTGPRRRAFARILGVLITGLGAVAIIGPEEAHLAVNRLIGALLILVGLMALLALATHRTRHARQAVLAWSLVALATGAAMELMPLHGLSSAGALLGLLFVGHGLAASSVAFRRWRPTDVFAVASSLAASFLLLIGLALLFGDQPGDRWDQVLIGVDIVLFGAYLIVGREVLASAGESSVSPK